MKKKYRQVSPPKGYPGPRYSWGGRVLEHHLAWWQATGKIVPKGYVVHHKNGDGKDNRPENLECMPRGAHTTKHCLIEPDVALSCSFCNKKFMQLARVVRYKRRKGRQRFFCSSSCAARQGHEERLHGGKEPLPIRHGTPSGYNYRKCRCEECRAYKHRAYLKGRIAQ